MNTNKPIVKVFKKLRRVFDTNEYLIKAFFKKYLSSSIFCVAAATITMTIDNLLTGILVGADALAAVNVATPVYVLITLISGILSAGSGGLSAKYIGRNEKEKVNSVFTTTCLTIVFCSGLLMLLFYTSAPRMAYLLGARDDMVNQMACQYIYGLSLGVFPIILYSTLSRYCRVFYDSKILAVSMGMMSLSDIVLDVLFAGIFKMGMFGMALASSVSNLLALIITVQLMDKQKTSLKLTKPQQPFRELRKIINLGLPDALKSGCSVINSVAANNLLVIIGGTMALSAGALRSSIGSLTSSIVMGVGFTIAPFVSLLYGERDVLAMEKLLRRGLKKGVLLCACAYAVVFVLAYPLCLLFGMRDAETIQVSMMAIRLGSSSMMLGTINSMLRYYYQSIERIWLANLLTACKTCLYTVLCMFAFLGVLGLNAIWISTLFAELLTLITNYVLVAVIQRKVPAKLADFMLLPKDFEEDCPVYEISIGNDLSKVVELSRSIQAFCDENGVEKKSSYYTALCIEEMASNVVQYGFEPEEVRYMDIKVSVTKAGVVFRMRDNGRRFNPFAYLEESEAEQDADSYLFTNIGIRMVKKLAREVSYRYSVGMNYLFVTL